MTVSDSSSDSESNNSSKTRFDLDEVQLNATGHTAGVTTLPTCPPGNDSFLHVTPLDSGIFPSSVFDVDAAELHSASETKVRAVKLHRRASWRSFMDQADDELAEETRSMPCLRSSASDINVAGSKSLGGKVNPLDEKFVVIEVCCGCARVTKSCQSLGMKSVGVDWSGCKDKPEGRVFWHNLATDQGFENFMELLEANKGSIKVVYMSPPCGTASRAREIRRRKPNSEGKIIDPKPLRSDAHPDGLPWLKGIAKEKVRIANVLYANMVRLAEWCDQNGIAWAIENPSNSHMWETMAFRRLRKAKWDDLLKNPYERVKFQNCMHGGSRPKRTDIMFAKMELGSLAIMCDGNCTHKPWGLTKQGDAFATAEERRYPRLLCDRLAKQFLLTSGQVKRKANKDFQDVISANKQPRRGEPDLLVQKADASLGVGVAKIGAAPVLDLVGLPVSPFENEVILTPEEFLEKAKTLIHPYDRPVKVPPQVAKAICKLAAQGPQMVQDRRLEVLEYYTSRRDHLKDEETALHSKLEAGVQKVIESKNVLLFKEMLRDIHYDDIAVADLLVTGVKIVGTLDRVGIWRLEDRQARITTRALLKQSFEAKDAIGKKKSGAWTPLDDKLVESTLAEVDEGHLEGPFSAMEIDQRLNSRVWIPARRFPLEQAGKLRPIDDFSEFGHNLAFGANEKVSLKSLDTVVAYSRAWMESADQSGRIKIHDTSGKVWTSIVDPSWQGSFQDLVGRVADLKGAYKQLPRHAAHRCFSVIVLQRQSGEVQFFEALSLMFGQTAAVYAFLRFSRALSALATELLSVVCVEFFDDFTH